MRPVLIGALVLVAAGVGVGGFFVGKRVGEAPEPQLPSPTALTQFEDNADLSSVPAEVRSAILPCGHHFKFWLRDWGKYGTIYVCTEHHRFTRQEGTYVPFTETDDNIRALGNPWRRTAP